MGNCVSGSAKDCEDSVELRVKKLLQPGGNKRGKQKSRTSIGLSNFAEYAHRLVNTKRGEEELDRQLERLNLIGSNCERLIFSVECGQSLRNALKNRYTNVLPYDSNRITLSVAAKAANEASSSGADADGDDVSIGAIEDADESGAAEDPLVLLTRAPADYVNASPIRLRDRLFIACQGPLPETLSHHWQMIWERQVQLVAMVTDCTEQGRSACAQYWPDEVGQSANYGQYTVTMEAEEAREDGRVVHRALTVSAATNGQPGDSRRVDHLQYLGLPLGRDWSGLDPADFCRFAAEVGAAAARTSDRPVVVHCDSGVGRTGVLLCLLSFSTDRVQASQQVDVPAAVIALRLSRPGMVHSRNQLAFVYRCLLYNLSKEGLISDISQIGNGEESKSIVIYDDDTQPEDWQPSSEKEVRAQYGCSD